MIRKLAATMLTVFLFALSGCFSHEFDIGGTWKSVGAKGWGQAQPGAIVRFGDGEANLYSPRDTYALRKSGDVYNLDVTGLLGGSFTFTLKVVDDDNIELFLGHVSSPTIVLKRV